MCAYNDKCENDCDCICTQQPSGWQYVFGATALFLLLMYVGFHTL